MSVHINLGTSVFALRTLMVLIVRMRVHKRSLAPVASSVLQYTVAMQLVWLAFVLSLAVSARGQLGCTLDQLEDITELTTLVQTVLVGGEAPTLPNIDINAQQIVCLAAAEVRDQYRYASVVIDYFCDGDLSAISPLQVPCNTNFTSQFDFECNNMGAMGHQWISTATLLMSGGVNFFNPSDASLSTSLRVDCSFCVDPDPSVAEMLLLPVDNITHCAGDHEGSYTIHVVAWFVLFFFSLGSISPLLEEKKTSL